MDNQSEPQDPRIDIGQRSRSRTVALLLGLMPGWGHIYWGREGLGVIFFTLFTPCFFSFVHSYFLYVGPYRDPWVQASVILLVLIYAGAWIELFVRTRPRRVLAEGEMRAAALKRGMLLYVQGDLEGAAQQFRQCLHLDPFDMEAQFRLGVVLARCGATRDARRWLRRARRYDGEAKWHWEIASELKRLRSAGKLEQMPERKPSDEVSSTETQGS